MKVLITGAAGYIGTELINHLEKRDEVEKIIAYDNLSRTNFNLFIGEPNKYKKVQFVRGEILDGIKLKGLLKDCDALVHLAAEVSTPFADANHHLFEQVNHWGTANVVEAAIKANIEHFIYLSSASVYGFGSEPFDATTNPKPTTIYGISKLRGEDHVKRLKNKMNTTIVRCANVYGYNPSMRFDAVINRFMFDANYSGKVTLQGDGSQYRPFIHVENVGRGITTVLLEQIKDLTINLVDRNETIDNIANEIQAVFPEMERMNVSQHLKLRSLQLKIDEAFNRELNLIPSALNEELSKFAKKFNF
ncbi:MAG: SDR family oxidoreductase [Salibacter sp.]|uniref:NAD-dependent epimerase/dehydratase family protein n=1 Tax=Salibacter sp. TaxID=2010995 RepID=UPI0028702E9D|nr:SDR family oxidoreductase [Salibacter sp.]MDR9398749.1 SDR family oxidoreductase [Salibacter sp.]